MRRTPLVGLPSDRKQIGPHPFQAVGEKYLRAVVDDGVGLPVAIPSLQPPLDLATLLDDLDGLLLTGAYSNIEPHHYGAAPAGPDLSDPARDASTLPLVSIAIAKRVPVLAVCRGLQEVNVALGGSLHQAVHQVAGHADHRADPGLPIERRYGDLAHPVAVTPGGLLERIAGCSTFEVNSLHSQSIARLADGLRVEARAPDGVIEAVSMPDARGFALAVQWHPEWNAASSPVSMKLLDAFGQACRAYRKEVRR